MHSLSKYIRALLTFLALGSALSGEGLFPALTLAAPEDEMKAAFVFYFAKFVDWPASAFSDESSPLVLGVIGDETMNNSFSGLHGKLIKNRILQVKRLTPTDNLTGCHIVFLGTQATERQTHLAVGAQANAILTISDSFADFAKHGIVANLIFVDHRIKLELSSTAAHRAGLAISAQVLQLAKVVDGGK
jgi:hypothetical protein